MTPDRAPASGGGVAPVEVGPALAAEDFRRVTAALHADAGMARGGRAATLAQARLARRLRALGLRSFRDYCALVAGASGVDERQRRLAALAVEDAGFFRQPQHFEHLRAAVLAPLLDEARRGARVRLWSAACAGGAEAYSIAMVVLELLPEAASLDVKVLASDIDADMVARAREGRFPASALRRAPAQGVRRWFTPVGPGSDELRAGPELRSLIAFRELDLTGDWPMTGRFDAIFCRDVALYLEEEAQSRTWGRLAALMKPDSRLYVGRSERLCGPAAARFLREAAGVHRLGAAPP